MQEKLSGPEISNTADQKDPWDLTEEEFIASAEKGRLRANDEEEVIAVAEERKPVAVIPYIDRTSKILHRPEIIDKIQYKLFTHPDQMRSVAIVAPKSGDLDKLTQTYIDFFYQVLSEFRILK